MKKYLVTIEFRYIKAPNSEYDSTNESKVVTIGVYDTFHEATTNGNKVLEQLESTYPLHKFPNGDKAKRERFSEFGGVFGSKHTLITDLAYLTTPFSFSAKIVTLSFDVIDDILSDITSKRQEYLHWRTENHEDE